MGLFKGFVGNAMVSSRCLKYYIFSKDFGLSTDLRFLVGLKLTETCGNHQNAVSNRHRGAELVPTIAMMKGINGESHYVCHLLLKVRVP